MNFYTPGCMGTKMQAETKLREAYRAWLPYCQPVCGTPQRVREHEARERAAREQMVRAAALLGWHLNRAWVLNGDATFDPDDELSIGDAGERYEVTFFDENHNTRRVFGRTFILDRAREWMALIDSIQGTFPQLDDRRGRGNG